jgi:hypothetical protein
MRLREIDFDDVRRILDEGATIETYPDDTPFPSRLVLGWVERRPIHIVAADIAEGEVIVVTVYDPNPEEWSKDYRSRLP